MALSAFIAGLLMFLAPCTLPLVPGFLAFIGGSKVKRKIFMNAVLYVLGFTLVFVILGTAISFISITAFGSVRMVLTKVGGIFVIAFGLFMLDVIKFPQLQKTKQFGVSSLFKKGSPGAAFLLGASFAFGWSPCIGPLLASILLLASTSTTVGQGAFLLFVFSLGMGVPFLILAWGFGTAQEKVKKINSYMSVISKVGGVFLVVLGILLFFNQLGMLIAYGYQFFEFVNYDKLLEYY